MEINCGRKFSKHGQSNMERNHERAITRIDSIAELKFGFHVRGETFDASEGVRGLVFSIPLRLKSKIQLRSGAQF